MDQSSNKVQMVRLVSGEEILCKTNRIDCPVDGPCTEMTDPLILIPTRERGLALAPWLPYTKAKEDGVVISTEKILFTVAPHPELEKEYLSAISGLIIPTNASDSGIVGTIGVQSLSE